MPRFLGLFLLVALIGSAACSTAQDVTAAAVDPSGAGDAGNAITLAQAQQADAPALAAQSGIVTAVWVGSDERGVHQDARQLTDAGLSDVVTLPLPPTHPYDQRLFAGDDGNLHLLWLDADDSGQTNLYAALITPDLQVERGPVGVSEGLALRYSAVSDGAGGLWTAWSGGLVSEMNVYLRQIDADGRPLQTTTIATDATDPALVRTPTGDTWLFWLAEGQVVAQQLDPPNDQPISLTSAISLAAGDRLIDTGAALDSADAYYYWNVTRANGADETWITAGALTAATWRQPQRLRISADSSLSWFAPLNSPTLTTQQSPLIAVAQGTDGVGLVSLFGGSLKDYKAVVPDVSLIGLPTITRDVSGAIYAAWSAPGDSAADLQVMQVNLLR